jgi:hypothetical protein
MYQYVATEQYKVVWYSSTVCTNTALCHTKYAKSLYFEVDRVTGLQRHCYVKVQLAARGT